MYQMKQHWLEVAADETTSLRKVMIEHHLDPQSDDMAVILFGTDVQHELEKRGHITSARYCKVYNVSCILGSI